VRCWDPEGNRVAFDLEGGHTDAINTIVVYRSSASGTTRLLTVSGEGRAKVWETAGDSGALVLTLEDGLRAYDQDEEHTIRNACVFYGPTGSDRMAIGYALGTIRVWDAEAVRGSRADDNVDDGRHQAILGIAEILEPGLTHTIPFPHRERCCTC
jgi:WD40 repeat protein